MTFAEFLQGIFGWLAEFIEWLIGWVPRYHIVRCDEGAGAYFLGKEPVHWEPGVHWYVPNLTDVEDENTNTRTMEIEPVSVPNSEGSTVHVGFALVFHVVDVVKYNRENQDPDESMALIAQGVGRNIVTELAWAELCGQAEEGSRLEGKLVNRMGKALNERFGVEIDACLPQDQTEIMALRVFD